MNSTNITISSMDAEYVRYDTRHNIQQFYCCSYHIGINIFFSFIDSTSESNKAVIWN